MDYTGLFSTHLPADVESPDGLRASVKYIFSVTNADPATLPAEGFTDAVRDAMQRESATLAPYPPPMGHVGLRDLIVGNLKERRGIDTDLDSVFLTCGAGGAVETILSAFIDPGDTVLLEEFSYLGTLRMLLQRRTNVIHIPTDQDGMDTEALEDTIKALASRGTKPKLIYTISVYQNPMGMTLSLERRKHMLEISHRYGVPIVENESYADFRIDGDPLPQAMYGMDDENSVIYISSYTKLLGCGLRVGYSVAPESVRDTLGKMKFGTRPSHLATMMVHEYLRKHEDEHIENVRQSLEAKRDALLSALGKNFPPTCSWSKPDGGMMVWVSLPEGANTWAALDRAVEADVKYNPGGVFRANRDRNNHLRMTYSHNTPDEIRQGVAVLAEVFEHEGLFGG